MNGITREQFKMKKVSILKGGAINYKAVLTMQDGGTQIAVDREDTVPIIPAESLTQPIYDLVEQWLIACNHMGIRTLVNSFEFHATKKQKDAIEKYIDLLKTKTTVYQISVSGQDKNEGVIITGKMTADNNAVITSNTPRIKYTSKIFGWEEDLEAIVILIEDELYEYLYSGRKLHIEAFDPEEQKGEKAGELPLKDGEKKK